MSENDVILVRRRDDVLDSKRLFVFHSCKDVSERVKPIAVKIICFYLRRYWRRIEVLTVPLVFNLQGRFIMASIYEHDGILKYCVFS